MKRPTGSAAPESSLASLLRDLAGYHGPVRRRLRSLLKRITRRDAPDPIAGIIREFARAYPDALFIQIGSNDGTKLDPLRTYILEKAWRGVMIEPVPYVFERLRTNYGSVARVTLENVAIADREGLLPFYHLRPPAPGESVPRLYDAIGSFRREIVLKHADRIPDIEQRLVCAQIPCLTFEGLCRRHGIEQMDIIQMDTEGYDLELLRTIDFKRFRPRLLMFERHHLTDAEKAASRELLARAGYDTLDWGLDTLALNMREQSPRDHRLFRTWDAFKAALGKHRATR